MESPVHQTSVLGVTGDVEVRGGGQHEVTEARAVGQGGTLLQAAQRGGPLALHDQ